MTVLLIAVAAATIALPHVVRPAAQAPAMGVVLWASALTLRALATFLLAVVGMALAASSDYARGLAHFLWHTDLPATVAPGADGHTVVDVVLLLPALGMAAAVGYGVWRSAHAARYLRRAVDRTRLGEGPGGSVLVAEPEPMVAAIGLLRARVVISAGALHRLEADELEAAIAHERAHISRGHRFLLLFAALCVTFARWQPGTTSAWRELRHQLERDADRSAAHGSDERLALASAICKVALSGQPAPSAPGAGLSGTGAGRGVVARVRELSGPAEGARSSDAVTTALAGLTVLTSVVAVLCGLQVGHELTHAANALAHHPAG